MNKSHPEAEDWNASYELGRPPWDLNAPPPALVELLNQLSSTHLKVLVPCAGLGNDAIAWATAGHDVVAVDFAPRAVAGAAQQASERGVELMAIQADLFKMKDEFQGAFDAIWEQTCLCAIDPGQREKYFQVMSWALEDEGTFYGLFWNHGRAGGPPYDLTPEAIEALVPAPFQLEDWAWVKESASGRRNEFLVTLKKK